jgi:hypothetical protein
MKAAFSTRPNTRSCHTCVFNHFSFTDSTLGSTVSFPQQDELGRQLRHEAEAPWGSWMRTCSWPCLMVVREKGVTPSRLSVIDPVFQNGACHFAHLIVCAMGKQMSRGADRAPTLDKVATRPGAGTAADVLGVSNAHNLPVAVSNPWSGL